jgi:PAS domain S-box-containing protein
MSGNSSDKVPILSWRFLSKTFPGRRSIWILLVTVFFISLLDLAGWIFDIDLLKSIQSTWESMELISALCFILSTLTLAIIQMNLSPPAKRILSMSFAFVVCVISLGTLYVYIYLMITGHESPIAQLSFLSIFLSTLYRMDILTAVNFFLTGCILFLFAGEKKRSSGVAHIITIPVFLISYLTIISYILNVYKADDLKNISVALNTAIAFCGICLAVLLIRPDTWIMKLYLSRDTAGIISRKLFPALVFLPVVIGWLRIQGEHSGVIKSEEGVALVAIAYVFCFIILIWLTARSIDKIDRKRRSVEEALRESEERFRTIAESAPVLVCITRVEDSVVMFTNEVNNKTFGLRGEDMVGTKGPDYYCNPNDRKRMISILNEQGTVNNFEVQVKKSDGTPFWIMTSVRNIIYNGYAAMIGASIDITESKKIEEELLISEERFRAIAENIPDLIARFDSDLHLQYANPAVIRRTGLSFESLLGKTALEYGSTSEASENWEKAAREVLNSGESKRIEQINYWMGATRVFDALIVPEMDLHGKVSSVISIARDITEKKQSEDNIKASEDRFRTIAESLPVLICIYNIKDSAFSFVNEHFEKTFGYYKGELITRKLPVSFFNSVDRKDLGNLLKEKGRAYNKEIRVKKADGTPFWIMSSIQRILFMNEPSYLTASIDITETKKAQEELLRLNRTLDAHSKSSHAMMHSNNEMNYINEVCKIIIEDCGHAMVWVGYARNDKEKTVSPIAYYGFDQGYIDQMNITWDDSVRGKGPTGTAIRTGKPALSKNMLDDPAFKPWRKAAIERGYSSSLVLPLMSDGKSFGAISIYSKEPDPFSELEITLLSELADDLAYGISFIRLTESEREAARIIKESESKLKELVTTKDKFFNIVAHDLKNPFTSLLGSSELLYNNIDQMSADNIRKLALILNDSAKGGYSILQNLLDWSRSETGLLKFNPENINLRIVVNESLENVQLQVANKGISAISELTEDFFIFTDKNMINTVLRNLISNAVKYTYKKGTVVVRAKKNAEECIITVKDSGIGIEKEKVSTLFRLENSLSLPGTEKEQGTGLGLKLCKEFTERMGGRIWVESKEGRGSEFKFTIPVKKT